MTMLPLLLSLAAAEIVVDTSANDILELVSAVLTGPGPVDVHLLPTRGAPQCGTPLAGSRTPTIVTQLPTGSWEMGFVVLVQATVVRQQF